MQRKPKSELRVPDFATITPDLVDLRALCMTVELRSLTAVARRLGESTSTVSRRLSRLEQQLGVTLLRRDPRHVEATEDGLAYAARAAQALDVMADANARAQQASTAPSGRLRITLPPELGELFAPHLIEFRRRFPMVTLDVLVSQTTLDLRAEGIDAAFRVAFQLRDSSLVALKLKELELALVGTRAYLKKRGRIPRKPEDLARHDLVLLAGMRVPDVALRSPEMKRLATIFAHAGSAAANPGIRTSDLGFAKQIALADGGLAVLPRIAVTRELADGRLVSVLDRYLATGGGAAIYFVRQGGVVAPKVRALRDFVVELMRSPSA